MISEKHELKNLPLFSGQKNWDDFINFRFKHYEPHTHIEIKSDKYSLTTATSITDLKNAFFMRHHIFFIETGISKDISFDVDEFDFFCDHLVIRNNYTNEICATYRLLSNKMSCNFYSETEFDLSGFLQLPGVKLELGRACIHPDHRNGSLTDLLWKGIGKYCKKIQADALFGCSSVKINSPKNIYNILNLMKENDFYSEEFHIQAKKSLVFTEEDKIENNDGGIKKLFDYLPPLLKTYILAGAKIYGHPAYDKEFNCTDFFTILFLDKINPSFKKRYLQQERFVTNSEMNCTYE